MKAIAWLVCLTLIGLPSCLFVSIGILTMFDPSDQWRMPPTTDFVLAIVIFLVGVGELLWLKKEGRKEGEFGRIADPFKPDPMRRWYKVW